MNIQSLTTLLVIESKYHVGYSRNMALKYLPVLSHMASGENPQTNWMLLALENNYMWRIFQQARFDCQRVVS